MPKVGQEKGTPARRTEFLGKLRAMGEGRWCVLWPWSDNKEGYTQIHVDGVKVMAHRWVYAQIYGGIEVRTNERGAVGQVILHTCDFPPCVRPSHLICADQETNIRDAVAKGRMRPGAGGDFHRKLTDEDILLIREMKAEGAVQAALARAFGVSEAEISMVVHNKRRMPPRPPQGEREISGVTKARLTLAQVEDIKRLRAAGVRQSGMARAYGVSPSTIGYAVRNRVERREKLSPDDVAEIRRLAAIPGTRQTHLARAYDVSDATISRIVRGLSR